MSEKEKLRTIKADDLFQLQFLQDGRFSPDGKKVVYVVSHADTEKDQEHAAVWLLSPETGESRQLTSGLTTDLNPMWSPDGKHIAFMSSREEKPQIYLIPVGGGEARALTALAQGVGGGPVWSPDGKHIAFTAKPDVEPPDPTKPYRLTRHVYRFDMMGYLENALQDIYVIPVAGGEPKQLTADDCNNAAPVWSPDGQEILFTTTMPPDSHKVMLSSLKAVNLEGEVREVLGDWGQAAAATWTPDGERVVFIGNPASVPFGAQGNLWVIDSQGGEPEPRTADFGYQVGGGLQPDMPVMLVFASRALVAQDGQAAYVQVQKGGQGPIYRVALSGPESCTPVVGGERACLLLDRVDERLLFAVSTHNNPIDLFSAGTDGSNEQQLTHLNADLLAECALPTFEHLSFPSSDGVEVEGWIMKPSVGEAPYPTIVYSHGGPAGGFGHIFSFDSQMLAGAGYAVLLVNFRGSTGYGDEFSGQIVGDFGRLEYEDVMAGLDFVIEQGIADPDLLGCCGLSYGGFMSCWIVGHTDRFKAAVPENPVTNWFSIYGVSDIGPGYCGKQFNGLPHEVPEVYARCSPITYAHRCTTPTLLIQGEHDFRCPAEQSEQFYAVLKASGCIVEMLRLPFSPHVGSIGGPLFIRRAQNEALLEWMNRYILGKEPAPEEQAEEEGA